MKTLSWEHVLDRSNQSQTLAVELLTMFSKELPHYEQLFSQTVSDSNQKELCDHLHTFTSSCLYCGAQKLHNLVSHLEASITKLSMDSIQHQLSQIVSEIHLVKQAVSETLKQKA